MLPTDLQNINSLGLVTYQNERLMICDGDAQFFVLAIESYLGTYGS